MPRDLRDDDAAETSLTPGRGTWRWSPPALAGGRRFVFACLLLLGLQAVSVMALNVAVDPRGEFGTRLVPPLTANHGSERVHLLDTVADEPRTLILGNSRAMTMRSEHLAPLDADPVFNFAIGGGSAQDALVLYRFMDARGYPLEQVVYAIDIIQVESHKGVNNKIEGVPELAAHTGEDVTEPSTREKLLDSIDDRYVRDSLRSLAYEVTGRPDADVGYAPDGAVVKHPLEEAVSTGRFDAEAAVQGSIDRIEDKLLLEEQERTSDVSAVATLIEEAREDDVTVRLFLPPMHPDLVARLEASPFEEDHEVFRDQLLTLCQPGVHVHDLRRIETFGGREDRFYDAWHAFGENHRRVAEALIDPSLDLCAR